MKRGLIVIPSAYDLLLIAAYENYRESEERERKVNSKLI